MKLAQVLEFLGLTTSCEACELKTMQTDSRQVKPGDLFVAVPGINTDGRDYITDAISNGAGGSALCWPSYYRTESTTTITRVSRFFL